jgi:hypothetical protein
LNFDFIYFSTFQILKEFSFDLGFSSTPGHSENGAVAFTSSINTEISGGKVFSLACSLGKFLSLSRLSQRNKLSIFYIGYSDTHSLLKKSFRRVRQTSPLAGRFSISIVIEKVFLAMFWRNLHENFLIDFPSRGHGKPNASMLWGHNSLLLLC